MDALKSLLSGGRAIAYYPELARVVGGVNEAIFLQQLMHWTKGNPDEWFWHTGTQIREETALTEEQQLTARRKLVKIGAIKEEKRGLPQKLYFQVQWDIVKQILEGDDESLGNKLPGNTITTTGKDDHVIAKPGNINKNNEMKEQDDIQETSPSETNDHEKRLEPRSKPYALYEWYCRRAGLSPIPKPTPIEMRYAKQLVNIALTNEELDSLYDWLKRHDFWGSKPITIELMARQLSAWRAAKVKKVIDW